MVQIKAISASADGLEEEGLSPLALNYRESLAVNQEPETPTSVDATRKILIVEDDVFLGEAYKRRLESEGYTVTLQRDGAEGFYRAHQESYDLIMLDVMLPNMDGLAVLKRLKAQKRFKNTPIIMMTNAAVEQVQPEAAFGGAAGLYVKSRTSASELAAAVRRLIASEGPDAASQNTEAEGDNNTSLPTMTVEFLAQSDRTFRPAPDFRVPSTEGPSTLPKLRMVAVEAPPVVQPPPIPPPPPPAPESLTENPSGLLSRLKQGLLRSKASKPSD